MKNHKKGIFESLISGVLWAAYSVVLFELLDPYRGDLGDTGSAKGIMFLILAAVGIAFIDAVVAFIFELIFCVKEGKLQEFFGYLKSPAFFRILPAAIFSGPMALIPFSIASRYSVSVATSITAFYPTLGSIIAVFYFKEKISKKKFVGMILAASGIAVTSGFADLNPIGVILAIIAAVGYSLELVFGYRLLQDDIDPTVSITLKQAAQIFVYAIVLIVLLVIPGNFDYLLNVIRNIDFNSNYAFTSSMQGSTLLIILFFILGSFFNASSYTYYYRGLDNAGVSTASSLNIAYGVWTIVILALPPFRVVPGLMAIIGSVLTFIGTTVVIVESNRLEASEA